MSSMSNFYNNVYEDYCYARENISLSLLLFSESPFTITLFNIFLYCS